MSIFDWYLITVAISYSFVLILNRIEVKRGINIDIVRTLTSIFFPPVPILNLFLLYFIIKGLFDFILDDDSLEAFSDFMNKDLFK